MLSHPNERASTSRGKSDKATRSLECAPGDWRKRCMVSGLGERGRGEDH